LRAGVVGRVGLCSPLGPRIIPLNYAVISDSIVWRTSPYSELALHGGNRELAVEVDHIDYQRRQAWSVPAGW
jgi:nitroimidazol reductase NimA-like FMN-containing flavoprotein (pyridoxamine 5'-phosphate oxidase superfamily)